MGVLVRIETIVENVLEHHQEFSDEHQDYIDKVIATFEDKLKDYLTYNINGFHQINAKFEVNPITMKFKLVYCDSPFSFHINNALSSELKIYN
ncbi:hypothetical protein ACFSKN_04780 [Mariniflexile gromovii]|uniref:Uncharacterized protein n=1 Tax=Mariniflexile gromovii TaxID=362523 RepID=A0ABS4BW90_9FLAO|nr:hypothetical protein [Mariniflexile gromovii]MBP0904837.1 hypothetical protein [Mariniflexile gromovii]